MKDAKRIIINEENKNTCINCDYASWTETSHGLIGNCFWFEQHFKNKPAAFIKIEKYGIMYSYDTHNVSLYQHGNSKIITRCDACKMKKAGE